MENQLDYDVNKELGECYLLMQDYGKAEEYYRKAVTSNPQLSAPYMGLATVAVQRGELDNAPGSLPQGRVRGAGQQGILRHRSCPDGAGQGSGSL